MVDVHSFTADFENQSSAMKRILSLSKFSQKNLARENESKIWGKRKDEEY
jgi:hypothetical protein